MSAWFDGEPLAVDLRQEVLSAARFRPHHVTLHGPTSMERSATALCVGRPTMQKCWPTVHRIQNFKLDTDCVPLENGASQPWSTRPVVATSIFLRQLADFLFVGDNLKIIPHLISVSIKKYTFIVNKGN